MKKLLILLSISCGFIFILCTSESTLGPDDEPMLLVVQAFVYAGEPVADVRLTSTLPLGSEDSLAPPVTDADVAIIKDGVKFNLEPSPGDSGYYHYSGSDFSIQTGDELILEILHNNVITSGESTVPPPPDSISISQDTISVPENIFGWFMSQDNQITVRWHNDGSSMFFVLVENMDPDPQPIISGMAGQMFQRFRFMTRPTAADSSQISLLNIRETGIHRVKVYRINQEYADLYASRNQDSRDLNEPLSNVTNGLGVFSAFNSDSLFFYVEKQ